MELRDSKIWGTGDFLTAKFPVDSSTFAPHSRINLGLLTVQTRIAAGREHPFQESQRLKDD